MSDSLLRNSKLPAEQQAIARRLREERRLEKFSQAELAHDAEIGRASLSHYEYGITALPFGAGIKLCRRMDLNQQWLATGRGERRPYVPLKDLEEVDPKAEDLFSGTFLDGFRELLAAPMRKWWKEHPLEVRIEEGMHEGPERTFARMSMLALERFIREESAVLREANFTEMKITVLSLIQSAATELQRRLKNQAARE